MYQVKNIEYFNWIALLFLIFLSGVKGAKSTLVKENGNSDQDGIVDFLQYSNHNRQNHSTAGNRYANPNSDIEFNTQIIPYEYIVKFTGFYKAENRQNYINVSLAKLDFNTKDDLHLKYRIIKRQNIMAKYPSDFDLVEFQLKDSNENTRSKVIQTLISHPLIKSVTPQQKVTRNIRTINADYVERNSFSNTFSDAEPTNQSDRTKRKTTGQVPTLLDRLMHTNSSVGCGENENEEEGASLSNMNSWVRGRRSLTYGHSYRYTNRRLLKAMPRQITSTLQADILWQMGVTGAGVKVAIFDTGLSKTHPHFKKIRERTNWTNEKTLNDELGHGTFVAGVIASSKECLGFAPDAEIHVFRVFTKNQVSYTSWFLDAFNYAIMKKIQVLNLSIGGPDFKDTPFVEKVRNQCIKKKISLMEII